MSKGKPCQGYTLPKIDITHNFVPKGTTLHVQTCCGVCPDGNPSAIPVATLVHRIPTEDGIEQTIACMLSIRGPLDELFCSAGCKSLLTTCIHKHNPLFVESPSKEQSEKFQDYLNTNNTITIQFLTELNYSGIDINDYSLTVRDIKWYVRPVIIQSAQVGDITTGNIEAFVVTKGIPFTISQRILENTDITQPQTPKIHFTDHDQTILTQLCPPGFSPIGSHFSVVPTMMFARPAYRNTIPINGSLLLLT